MWVTLREGLGRQVPGGRRRGPEPGEASPALDAGLDTLTGSGGQAPVREASQVPRRVRHHLSQVVTDTILYVRLCPVLSKPREEDKAFCGLLSLLGPFPPRAPVPSAE